MTPEQAREGEAAGVHRLLLGLVGAVCRWPRLVLAVSFALAGMSAWAFNTHLEYRTQRSDLVSSQKDYQRRWRQYLAEFGNDDDIVVVVRGHDTDRMRAALDATAAEVRRRSELFDRLFYKVDLRHLQDRALLFLPAEQIRTIQENLQSMALLLDFGPVSWNMLSLYSLLHEARERSGKILPGKPLSPADEQFLTQLAALTRSATATLRDPADYRNPWQSLAPAAPDKEKLMAEPQYFFSGDGTLAFLLTRPILEAGSFTSGKKSVDALREILARLRTAYPELQFGLTGLPVLENDEMAAAESDTRLASWLAIAGVSLLFLIVYRGIAYPLLTVTTLLVGTAWAMGWLTLTVGHLNILSATFAVMLIGMGDYGVLWVMRYEAARRQGIDVRAALLHTTTHVAIGNLTAATTLALAFFAAVMADFQAVAELGWIAGCGVLLCALACFTVLPALLTLCDRRTGLTEKAIPITTQSSWLPVVAARPRWTLGIGIAVTAGIGLFAFRITYDHNLLHLQARDLDAVKWELTLIEHTAGASWHALSYTGTQQEALALKARYETLPEVSRVVEAASLVPLDQERKIDQLRDIQHRLRRLPERGSAARREVRPDHPASPDLQAELNVLIGQLQPLADVSPQPLLAEVRRNLVSLRDRIERLASPTAEARLADFDRRLANDLIDDLHKLRGVSTPAQIDVADLPPEFRERYVGKSGKWLLRVFAKDCLWDFEPLEHFTHQIHSIDPEATGKPFATVEGLRAMKNGFQRAGLYAFAVIVAVLLCDFRGLRNTLIAIAPLVMGLVLALGLMGLFAVPLNPANMIAFPLILGVGVDNGVHVLHDYLLRRKAGLSTISYAIGRGVLVKALTTMIGFGTLMIASERGLAGLGLILTLGVGCCMVTALVFLPAVLRVLGTRRQKALTEETVEMVARKRAA